MKNLKDLLLRMKRMPFVNFKIKMVLKNNYIVKIIYLKIVYKNELKLFKNKLKIKTQKNSIIHFSINKSATQTVKDILTICSIKNDIIPIHWTNFAFNSKHPPLCYSPFDEVKDYSHIFKERGLFYSAFGGFVKGIPNLNKYKIILMVRDPRDILVSDYFSIAYSHLPPLKSNKGRYEDFMKRKEEALNSDIDAYVLNNMERVFYEFEKYKSNLLSENNQNNLLLLKYESMISDFEEWLKELVTFCEFDNINIKELSTKYKITPKKEEINKHIRKGIAGDYKNKLKLETINKINEKYSKLLKDFGYEI